MQWSILLGARKPESLQKIEKMIWKAILGIVNQPGNYLEILNNLASTFSSTAIQELESQPETVTSWFDLDLGRSEGSASAGSNALPNPMIDVTQRETSSITAPSLESQNGVTDSNEEVNIDKDHNTDTSTLDQQENVVDKLMDVDQNGGKEGGVNEHNNKVPKPTLPRHQVTAPSQSNEEANEGGDQMDIDRNGVAGGEDGSVNRDGADVDQNGGKEGGVNEHNDKVPNPTLPIPQFTAPSQSNEKANTGGAINEQLTNVGEANGDGGSNDKVPGPSTPAVPRVTAASQSNEEANEGGDRMDVDQNGGKEGGVNEHNDKVPNPTLPIPQVTVPSQSNEEANTGGAINEQLTNVGEANGDGGSNNKVPGPSTPAVPRVTAASQSNEEANEGGDRMDVDRNEGTGGEESSDDGDGESNEKLPGPSNDSQRSRVRRVAPSYNYRSNSSTSKKGKSRVPALVDQTSSSQKRVVMDESLKVLVVSTIPLFFFDLLLNMTSRKSHQ
jgi:hypothetical protein